MTDIGIKYIVKENDCLSCIAKEYLGHAYLDSKIFEHNNKPEVIAQTGSRIINKHLIIVGQTIYIPNPCYLPVSIYEKENFVYEEENSMNNFSFDISQYYNNENREKDREISPHENLTCLYSAFEYLKYKSYCDTRIINYDGKAKRIQSIPVKYDLTDSQELYVYILPTITAKIKLTGSIIIQSKDTYPFTFVTNGNLEGSVKHEIDPVLRKLLTTENKVKLNLKTKEFTIENGITLYSNNNFLPNVSISNEITSNNNQTLFGVKIKFSFPKQQGEIDNCVYITEDFGIEIELIPQNNNNNHQEEFQFSECLTSDIVTCDFYLEESFISTVCTGAVIVIGGVVLFKIGALAAVPAAIALLMLYGASHIYDFNNNYYLTTESII